MNIRILSVLGLALIGVAACGNPPIPTKTVAVEDPSASNTMIPTSSLALIGARIYLSPEKKEAILAEASMTEESFLAVVEQLSLDSESAHRYAQAFEVALTQRSD